MRGRKKENGKPPDFFMEEFYMRLKSTNGRISDDPGRSRVMKREAKRNQRTLERKPKNGNLLFFKEIEDFVDVGLDVWRRRVVKKKEEVQKEPADLGSKLLVLDPR